MEALLLASPDLNVITHGYTKNAKYCSKICLALIALFKTVLLMVTGASKRRRES